jgi:hypothetical protein
MIEMKSASVATANVDISIGRDVSNLPILHIVCDWDVGLFNLVLGAIAHICWACTEGRIPIIYYGKSNCYWTPNGYQGRDTVWEYYFEPVIPEYPVSRISPHVLKSIADNPLQWIKEGQYFVDEFAFVSDQSAWHVKVDGERLRGPKTYESPSRKIRELASTIVRGYIRPRDYIVKKANCFFQGYLANRYLIGVHIRGTDALVDPTRVVRQSYINYRKYIAVLRRLLRKHPDALIFVASDEQASVHRIREHFGARVIAYDAIRHQGGESVGRGPAGRMMPAYLTKDRNRAAQNGEEAVIEYMLLCRCNYLVHNFSSIPRMVLLTVPDLAETNIDKPSILRRASIILQRPSAIWRHRAALLRDTIWGKPLGSWHLLLHELWIKKRAGRREAASGE